MEKAFRMGKASATGSFQLFVGIVTSTAIMAVGTVVIVRVMAPADYGLYSLALIPSLAINLFRDWGMDSAIVRYISHSRVAKKEDIHDIIAAGLIFEILSGLILSLLSVFLADFIAAAIFHRPELAPLVSIVSITIFSGSLLTAAQSSFIGFERMEFNSIALVCQAVLKSVLSPLLVLLGMGVLGAVLGYAFSFLATGILSSIMLYFFLFRDLKRTNRFEISQILRKMLRYGVPLSISSMLNGLRVHFYNFMMAFYCSDIMIGNFQAATNFEVVLTFLTVPISTVLFPSFAKVDSENESQLLETIFKSSVRYTAMLLIPATAAAIVLSKPMINTLFGEKWVYAPFFLTLINLKYLFSGFGQISVGNLLSGLGETKKLMKLSLLTLLMSFPLAFLLIPNLGIVGVIVGPLVALVPSMFLGLFWAWDRYGVTVDWDSSIRIFVASTIAAVTTYLSLSFLDVAQWLRLMTGGIVFLIAYIIVAPSIGAIVQDDISNLRAMLSDMGFVSKITNLALCVVEKIIGKNPIGKHRNLACTRHL